MGLQVGIVRDERYLEHRTGLIHPENLRRLEAVHEMLDQDFPRGLTALRPEAAGLDDLELVHTPAYIEKVLKTAERDFTYLAEDTPAGARTYLAAWLAVGGCLSALRALSSGQAQACFALIRPPGHHALPDRAGGFCIFNNLAVTARYALKFLGRGRVLIVDWDVHHGHGLQEIFFREKEVLYFSSHYRGWYPRTGAWEETGQGPGAGYTINLPLPREVGDEDILHLYREVLGPVVRAYRPELILVAAGFDAHAQDPLGRTELTEKAFGWLTRLLLKLGREVGTPPLLLALEGGYDPPALARSVREVLRALTGDEPGSELPRPETQRAAALVERARQVHGPLGLW